MEYPPELTTLQAAVLTGYHRSRIVQLAAAGKVKGRKYGSGARAPWIIDRDSLLAFRPEKTGPKRKSKPLKAIDFPDSPVSAIASQA